MVSDSLFTSRISSEEATMITLADSFAPYFEDGDTEALYQVMLESGRDLGGRLLIIDMDGKVQVDTYSRFNGRRLAHPEVVSVLNGADFDYGFHRSDESAQPQKIAPLDILRNLNRMEGWVGYFSAALLSSSNQQIGLVFYSVSVQDLVDSLRSTQDQMLIIFVLTSLAVFIMVLVFSRIITKPIAVLSTGIERMGRGDLSTRVKVNGIDEMARLGETFNQMSEKLETLDVSRNEFISNASHELKTPLATMKIMLESMLYQDNMDPALRKEFLTDINTELDRLSAIVTDLLTLVQSDANEYHLVRQDISLRDTVEETLHRLEALAHEKKQSLTMSAQTSAPIYADPTKIEQIIYNLVDNAIKYTPKGGKIRVIVKQEGKSAILEVIDNGPGIPKKDQTHIFDRFYRVDRARSRATGGNGLGLSIVHQSVMMHNGKVTVRSEEGKGATFRVELPLSSKRGVEAE